MSAYKLNFHVATKGTTDRAAVIISAEAFTTPQGQTLPEWGEVYHHETEGTLSECLTFAHDFQRFLMGADFTPEIDEAEERAECAGRYAQAVRIYGRGAVDQALHLATLSDIDGAVCVLEDTGENAQADALRLIFEF